ncbi:SdpI family protein [Chitinophaga sp. 22620]|uniref:SdpI family protein n=1 Tax=Chitinophaga sp. 22620 TaxID=3453952 RepID=UPI003F8691F0
MKHPDYLKEMLLLALLFGPMTYLGIIWPSLPATIPTNFNLNGMPDGVVEKREFLLLMIFLFFTNGLLYALFRYIPKPFSELGSMEGAEDHLPQYYNIRFKIHIYLAVFTAIVIYLVSAGREIFLEKWVFAGVGLLVAAIGLYLRNLKPNNFVGVRTPWTLQSDDIWVEVHHMASRLWLFGGLGIIVAGIFLPIISGVFLFIFAAGALAALPYIYSYRLFYKTHG